MGSMSFLNIYLLKIQPTFCNWYLECFQVGTEKTWSNSSSVRAFVSGRKRKTRSQRIKHQVAYQAKAPCGLNAVRREGQVKERMKLKHQVVAVAKDIPTSRICKGNASAE